MSGGGDPRVRALARLLVEYCVDVQPGWQVYVSTTPLARPLLEEVVRAIAERDAYALTRVGFDFPDAPGDLAWVAAAPKERLRELAPFERHLAETVDATIQIVAPENTRALAALDPQRMQLLQQAARPWQERVMSYDIKWVGCHFPTNALAQEAGMPLVAFEDFIYGACLRDWKAEGDRLRRIQERFSNVSQVRIEAAETDLTLSIEGRSGKVDDGHVNMPGGEVYFSPVEDSAEGTIAFIEFPALYLGRELSGIRLRFEDGRVVEASAASGEELLVEILETDQGARRLGELGFGGNPGITRHMRNVAFDEKIDGTTHLALGRSYTETGGTNESAIHWDLVKDLRHGGRIHADGTVVQQDGEWLL